MTTDLSYPIGKAVLIEKLTPAERQERIAIVAKTPAMLRNAVKGLTPKQLNTPYRDGGWTPRQVVHHLADSHVNAYIRFKLAMTETNPTIRPYDQNAWAQMVDSKGDIQTSLVLLEMVHKRWLAILKNMSETDFARTLVHPVDGDRTLDKMLCLYAWHGPHHIAHVNSLRERMGWKTKAKGKKQKSKAKAKIRKKK